jgi:hypothetical protein
MDAVFTVRDGPTGESLRYALRGLHENVDTDEVWMVGSTPGWVRKHHQIDVEQRWDRWHNTSHSLLAVCEHPDVSDPFMLWNDDFFALRPVIHLDWCHGPMRTFPDVDKVSRAYLQGRDDTLRYLREHDGFLDPLSFDLHVPLVVHKDVMAQAVRDTMAIAVPWKRSAYGNRALRAGLIPRPTTRPDPKIFDLESLPGPDWDWLSSAPYAFTVGAVGRWVRERFPDPSPYERI